MKKKIISFALTVAMVFGMVPGFVANPVFADTDTLLIAPNPMYVIAPNPADFDIMPVIAPNPTTNYDVCEKDSTCPLAAYTDLDPAMWYHDGVHYALVKGLMDGMGNGIFAPNGITTRAQVVTILWRASGEPYVNYAMPFTDVEADTWYTEAVRWAASEKIVEGYNPTTFGPKNAITREQLATVLFNFAKQQGIDTDAAVENVNTLSFDDIFTVSDWAKEGMNFCIACGIFEGDNGFINPKNSATRAQAATVLMRYCETFIETPEKTFTVSFNLNYDGKGIYETKTVKSGEKTVAPVNPTRSLYRFEGWFTNETVGDKFDFNTAITADLVLYARWTRTGGYVPYTPPAPVVPVTGVNLNIEELVLDVGDNQTIHATVLPADATNKNVAWSSSNPSVASVDNDGKVTALSAGTATITVTTEDGDKTATCTVTVKPATYTVSFNMNGHGTTPAAITVDSGEKVTAPTTPTSAGITFVGWYKEAACTNQWNFDTDVVTADTTLYANWVDDTVLADYIMLEQNSWFTTLTSGTAITKTSVSAITFCSVTPPAVEGKVGIDLTAATTGKVKGYIVANGDDSKIYIVGDYIYGNVNCTNMFYGFSNLTSLDFGDFDTSNVTQMGQMFRDCSKLNSLNLSKFNTSKVTVFYFMFKGCSSLKSLEFDNFVKFETANVSSMFDNCMNLKSVKINTPDEDLEDELWGGWNYEDGYYERVNKCVAEIIALNSDFPTNDQSNWVNESNFVIFYKLGWLHIKKNDYDESLSKGKDAVTKVGDVYEYTNRNNIIVRFNVTGGNLTSIDVLDYTSAPERNGTYAPSSSPE